jgi:hypothetical protein
LCSIPNYIQEYAESSSSVYYENIYRKINKEQSSQKPNDVWSCVVDQIWLEFLDVPATPHRPQPLLEAVPLTLWLFQTTHCDNKSIAQFYILAKLGAKVSLQINHFQLLFLLRLIESLTEFKEEFLSDSKQVVKEESSLSLKLCVVISQVELALLGKPSGAELPQNDSG